VGKKWTHFESSNIVYKQADCLVGTTVVRWQGQVWRRVAGMDFGGLCRASWRDQEIPGTITSEIPGTITCDINLLAFGQVNLETRIINSW
jgi:hypothetical protein